MSVTSDSKPKQRTRPTRAQTRARLLQAASEVFAKHGYDRASLDDVAAAAGLTKGAVYSSFASKDELFYALMRERIDERLALVAAAVDRQTTLEDTTRDAGAGLVELIFSQADWHLLFIEFWARAVRDPRLREEFARQRRSARELIARFLEQQAAQLGIELPVPADQLAVAVLALSNGIAIEQLADPDTVDASVFGTTLGLLLDGLGMPTTGSQAMTFPSAHGSSSSATPSTP
jgi:AcrR family transcriptional regulator